MFEVPKEGAATQRARWLAELTHALEEAQMLVWTICAQDGANLDALELGARLEAVRAEVRSLRVGRSESPEPNFSPEWTNHPWDRSETA